MLSFREFCDSGLYEVSVHRARERVVPTHRAHKIAGSVRSRNLSIPRAEKPSIFNKNSPLFKQKKKPSALTTAQRLKHNAKIAAATTDIAKSVSSIASNAGKTFNNIDHHVTNFASSAAKRAGDRVANHVTNSLEAMRKKREQDRLARERSGA